MSRRLRLGLRLRLALLYGVLLAVVGAALLALAVYLVDSSVAGSMRFAAGSKVEVTDSSGDTRLVNADDLQAELRARAREDVLQRGALVFGLVVLTGAAVGYAVAARALGPVAALTTAAQRLSSGTLDRRLELTGPRDELRELADTFDAMLERLDAAFDSQRRFVANASHELRTPLTVIRTEVDVALADPDASTAELRRMGEAVRTATERADRLVDALLVLARSEAQARQGLDVSEPVDLARVVPTGLAALEPEIDRQRLNVVTELGPAWVDGDQRLLERLVGNLVENAVRHNVEGGWVTVRTRTDGGRALVTVANTGPHVGSDDVEELFSPFRRGGTVRTGRGGGTGLGLSISRAVTTAHGGRIQATPRPDGGLDVEVDLPAISPPEEG